MTASNWLAALRAARRELGEEGGVPPGASCVMSGGGVTILDPSSRRRFVLSRTTEDQAATTPTEGAGPVAPAQAVQTPSAHAEDAAGNPPIAARRGTMSYSPEESAAVRAQLAGAQKPEVVVKGEAPSVEPPRAPTPIPAAPIVAKEKEPEPAPKESAPVRKGTMAYSPEESAAIRAQMGMAPKPEVVVGAPPTASAAAPLKAVPQGPAAAPQPAISARKGTMAYSPEESAEIRAQMQNAQKREIAISAPTPEPATRKGTVAYLENPLKPSTSGLITVASRDAEPSQTSPLIYRERSFYAPHGCDEHSARAALHEELVVVQAQLAGRGRGIFVSLALFDHYFQGNPQRAPIATLEWKDWRGDPAYLWLGNAPVPAPQAPPQAAAPVPAAAPRAAAPAAAPAQPVPARAAPAQPMPAPTAPAPSSPFASSPGVGDSWAREGTGEQDRRLATAFEAVQDLYFLASAADGLDFAVKLLSELIACDAVSGCLYDINTDELRFVAATGPGADARRANAVRSTAGLLGQAAHSMVDVVRIPEVANDPRFERDVDGREGLLARNMLFFPLHLNETLLGVLQLINRARRDFTDSDVAVGTYVAKQVSEFLQSKRATVRRPR